MVYVERSHRRRGSPRSEEGAAKHGFKVKAILDAAKKRQQRSGRKVVSFQPKKKVNA
jgi:hypothetical protein